MSDFNWTQFFVVGIIALIIGGVFVGIWRNGDEKECPAANQTQTDCPKPTNQTDCPTCGECETCLSTEEEIIMRDGYLIDGFFLEESISKTLDNELILFDGKVEFDGDDYDAEERFIINPTLKANEPDFEGNVYLTFQDKGLISYDFVFLETLNISAINSEETIIFNLLGEEVEVSEWEDTEITFTKGKTYRLTEGETRMIDGKNVTLEIVLEGTAYVSVDDSEARILEGRIKTIGDIEIKAKEVLYDTRIDRNSEAVLIIGEDIETTISDSEEYEKDSIWEWVINEYSIGLTSVDKFMELESDDNFNALAPEEKICLPNDYICVRYNGLIGEDIEEYTFELDSSGLYIKAKGNFLNASSEGRIRYDRIYISPTLSIYKDSDLTDLISDTSIELEDMGLTLDVSSSNIVIEDFGVNFDLDVTEVYDGSVWKDISSNDEDYLTNYGILIENPESSIKDEYFTLVIPEEKLEGIITVKKGGFEEITDETDEENSEEEPEE